MASQRNVGTNRLFDYFVIFGLDENSGLEVLQPNDVEVTNEFLTWSPLERSYKPKILAHYPDNVPLNPFDHDAVRNLCLPNGLIFRTQKHGREPSFHSFVITRENGSRSYGFSYTFYEPVTNKHVITAIQTLQAMHLTELSTAKSYHERRAMQNRNIRNVQSKSRQKTTNNHHHPPPPSNHIPFQYDETNTRSLPRHFKLAGHKGASLSIVQNFFDVSKDSLFVTKGIALISTIPCVHLPRLFLSKISSSYESLGGDLSLESYIGNLLYDIPFPLPSKTLRYSSLGEPFVISRPGIKELPLLDYFLADLFRLLDINSLLQLFTCLLLEHQVLLYSKDLYRLMVVAECMTALLFPFLWQHVYVPILPSTLHHFLDAPVPFIMGLHKQATECDEEFPAEANLCFLDIDQNHLQTPEDLPNFPQFQELADETSQILKEYGVTPRNSYKIIKNSAVSGTRTRRKTSHGSCSQDSDDSGMSSNDESVLISSNMTQSHQSHALVGLLRKDSNEVDVLLEDSGCGEESFLQNLKINNAIRQIFVNRFVHIFSAYEHFVINPDHEPGRTHVHNFDKATFLSDQPDQFLPFLSPFLETQNFASFIDRKIAAIGGEMDSHVEMFDDRIRNLRMRYGESLVRTPSYEPCRTIRETSEIIEHRFRHSDFCVPLPKPFHSEDETFPEDTGFPTFPILSKKLLNKTPPQTRRHRKWIRDENGCKDENSPPAPDSSLRTVFIPMESRSTPASIAQANWEFVKQLLQEVKAKTKRMLVEKMGGEEAVALGHGDLSIVGGIEERTLVASLCDLLERIWSQGLHVRQKGKSPLWNYLSNYEEAQGAKEPDRPLDPRFLSPALAWCILRKRLDNLSARAMELNLRGASPAPPAGTYQPPDSPVRQSRSQSRGGIDIPVLKPLPVSIASDMRNIQAINEIKTEIGYARAWIRLSLEKKVLSKHLRALLSDEELLRGFYKRTAFLRSEEEREQFLYHILTLNAVDYFSFTNTYTNILLPYRILIYPSTRTRTLPNLWMVVSGTLGETRTLHLPLNQLDFVFQHKNLGFVLSLRVGLLEKGAQVPKLFLEHVVLRNEVTGFCRKFPCGRWLGRDVEDGSTERLLLAETFDLKEDENDQNRLATPPRIRSPSVPRKLPDCTRLSPGHIQKFLASAVDRLVKYDESSNTVGGGNDGEKRNLTLLLCGDEGLVPALDLIFQYGFRSSRLFTKYFYIWDYFLRVAEYYESELEALSSGEREGITGFVDLVQKVQSSPHGLGKEGKFQLLVCLSVRDHLLHHLPFEFSTCPVTGDMYERDSFLRDPRLLSSILEVLEPLGILNIRLDHFLSKGIQ